MTTTNPDERPPVSADQTIDGALDTLHRLDTIGEFAYLQNAPVLIAEATARAAVADAVTNRIRLLNDLLLIYPAATAFPGGTREYAVDEFNRLLRSVVIRDVEA